MLPVYVLQGSSCYLVALIVFLRLLSIKYPLRFRTTHRNISNIISVSIWIALSLIASIGFISSFYSLKTGLTARVIAFHIFFSLPILSTIVMYGVLLHILKQKADIESNFTENSQIVSQIISKTRETKKSTAKLVKGVVICMIVCNLPWILWIQYLGVYINSRFARDVVNTNFGVRHNILISIRK